MGKSSCGINKLVQIKNTKNAHSQSHIADPVTGTRDLGPDSQTIL